MQRLGSSRKARPAAGTTPRLAGLDGLRGLAALAVVCLHVWMYTDANHAGHSVLLDAVVGEFRVAVGLFFVLSGFLLARPWIAAARGERPSPALGRFALRRAARIAPAYWVALLGSFLLLNGTGHGRAVDARVLPIFAAFQQNSFSQTRSKLDPPMWSLGIEVAFYVVLPLIGWMLVRAARRRTAAGPLLVCAALTAAGIAWSWFGVRGHWSLETMWTLPTYLPLFAAGIAAAAAVAVRAPARRTGRALLAAGALLVAGNGWWHATGTGLIGHVVTDQPAAIGFAAIVAVVATRPPGLLATPPLRALGALSYGLYLWHMPVLFALRMQGWFPPHAGPALVRVLVPSLGLAALSWFAVERPVLRWSERVAGRPHRPARAAPLRSAALEGA